MLQQVLQNLGLSDKEAKVYLALLELGPSSAYEISKKTGIHHSTVYMEAESLRKKSLVSIYEQSKKIKYVAEPPLTLNMVIDKTKKELENKEKNLKLNLTELNTLFMANQDKAVVRFYEGREGLEALENDADEMDIAISLTVYSFTPLDILEDQNLQLASTNRRIQRGLHLKQIYTHKDGHQNHTDLTHFREARFLSRDKFPFDAAIVIAPNHSVRLFSYKNGFKGFWIQNPDIANTLKMMWDVFWEIAEEEK